MLFIKIPARWLAWISSGRGRVAGGAILAVALLVGCVPSGPRALLQGKELLEKGQPEKAVPVLRSATELLGTNAHAWNYLGLAYHYTGRLPEAANAYRRALSLDNNLMEARYNLGESLLALGQLEAARAELTAYTLRRPNSVPGWLKLGSIQLRTRDFAGAEKSAQTAVRLSPDNGAAWNVLGLARLYRGRAVEAVECFDRALKVLPDFRPALLNSAVVLHQQLQNGKAALPRYKRYVQLKPTPENVAAILAIIRQLEAPPPPTPVTLEKPALTNHLEAVVAISNPSAQVAPPAVNLTASAQPPPPVSRPTPPPVAAVVTPSSQPAPAAPVQTPPPPVQIVQLPDEPEIKAATDPPPPVARKAAAAPPVVSNVPPPDPTSILAKRAEPPPKRNLFSRLNPLNLLSKDAEKKLPPPKVISDTKAIPPPPPPLVQAAPASPVIQNYPRYQYLAPAKPAAGDRTAAQPPFLAGLQAQQTGRATEAIKLYRDALRLDPSFFEAEYNLGVALGETRRLPEALAAYEQALALRPDSADARYNLALLLKQAGYVPNAAMELERLLQDHPSETRGHMALANLYAQNLGQKNKARRHYLKVLELDPRHPQSGVVNVWLAENP